ncbi:hypothetical protein F5883DRAFT_523644 [Diaporthe sp. PMI_573]|nr:hypothetical protein F5883DRAFT_523644 [Diaporthaceae sp. PMI_573]
MAPVFNTTTVCNTTEVCANALDIVQERLDDARRLSHILASLFGIVFLLFICSPLIFNLPRERNDYARRAPPPLEDEGIQMQDFERRDIPEPDEFAIDSEEDEPSNPSQSTLPDSSHFRTVTVDGETFHVAKSDATLLAETGVFRGAGDERQLAQRCVEEAQPKSVASSPVLPSRSYSAEGEGGHENSPHERIGTAV